MIRLWGKIIKKNRISAEAVVPEGHEDWPRLKRVKAALDEIVTQLDLPRPIWFTQNEQDILTFGRTEFTQDHFIEPLTFRKLEIEVIDDEKEK